MTPFEPHETRALRASGLIPDLFAGPGGWSQGLRQLGLSDVGIEKEVHTCATREAAGHATRHADVTLVDPRDYAGAVGLIASPPCQDFSSAGTKAGEAGTRGQLVRWPQYWVSTIRPRWTVWEQVPLVLPIWRECAHDLRADGYRVWTGVLNAADFGVPQERRRAVLIATLDGPALPPEPTHGRDPHSLFGELAPHVTLADVLGLEPGWEYDSGQNSRASGGGVERYVRSCDRPAGTLTGQTRSQWIIRRRGGDERRKLTFTEACRIQTFCEDYPFQGTPEQRDQQLGDAVPPLLAAHILSAVTGIPLATSTEAVA